jgi:hypothetical protein
MGSCLNMNAFVHMAGLAAVRAAQAGWAQTGNDATGTIVTASCAEPAIRMTRARTPERAGAGNCPQGGMACARLHPGSRP